MEIKRSGSQPSGKGPDQYFTGGVRIDPLVDAPEPARILAASVTFEPGARTAWHTHPLGQTLIVTSGCGWTQCWGEPKVEIHPGDVIWCAPGKKHWHGATAATAMTHIAIVEKLDGNSVDWMEKVSRASASTIRPSAGSSARSKSGWTIGRNFAGNGAPRETGQKWPAPARRRPATGRPAWPRSRH